ncbi:hypothetical protein TCAL_02477 [Tigriopus californicus]|uniref:G-protein coupled receptors family 1 profile domain-containing protein n=1 Tax=Tigriopus californicus TaxID=6832 RepID=A0A553NTA4_TIGCA|nr:RYamide receptor-like [Tigriopus californicus]XP_059098484.1 RYamide receptor-like [Tigriopus californicus]TRY68653.1 hypothetical protein TCAL_02477 [Tigriopus californicus]
MRSNFTGFHNGSNGELLKLATSSFEDVIDEALVEPPFDGRVPNMTVIDNMTYCWDEALQSYTWCHHEYQLYSVPLAVILFLSLCYGFISLVAIAGNILVFMVVAFTRSMQNVTNFYIANLASADVIIAVFCIPFQFYAALLQRWDLPEFMCKFCPFTQTLSVNVSIFTLVMISLDRYQAIMNPLAERSTKTTCKLIILGLWVFSAILALPMIFIFEFTYVFDESNGGVKPFCMLASLLEEDPHNGLESSLNNTTLSTSLEHHQEPGWVEKIMTLETYNLALTIVQYVLPLFIISFAYIRMGMKLWLSKTPGVAQVKRDEMIVVNKKKTIKMLVVVVTIFGICWLPWHLYQVSVILVPEINEYRYINIIFFFSHWLAMFNSCCNPFIYAIYSEKFKREFKLFAHCKICRRFLLRQTSNNHFEDRSPTSIRMGFSLHHQFQNGTSKVNNVGGAPLVSAQLPAVANSNLKRHEEQLQRTRSGPIDQIQETVLRRTDRSQLSA